jgi:hypothetical protein
MVVRCRSDSAGRDLCVLANDRQWLCRLGRSQELSPESALSRTWSVSPLLGMDNVLARGVSAARVDVARSATRAVGPESAGLPHSEHRSACLEQRRPVCPDTDAFASRPACLVQGASGEMLCERGPGHGSFRGPSIADRSCGMGLLPAISPVCIFLLARRSVLRACVSRSGDNGPSVVLDIVPVFHRGLIVESRCHQPAVRASPRRHLSAQASSIR